MCYFRSIMSEGDPIVNSSWADIDKHPRPWLIQSHKERIKEVDEHGEGKELASVCVPC